MGGREESGDAQGSPSGNPQVSPTCPSSVIGSTLTRIVRGPGSVPGWGLSNAVFERREVAWGLSKRFKGV